MVQVAEEVEVAQQRRVGLGWYIIHPHRVVCRAAADCFLP